MGANLSCVGCIEREHEQTPITAPNLLESKEGCPMSARNLDTFEPHERSRVRRSASEEELQAQLDAIVNAREEQERSNKKAPVLSSSDAKLQRELQDQINSIVRARKQRFAHAKGPVAYPEEHASPSVFESFSDKELAYHANLALSAAKERSTPAKSPSQSDAQWGTAADMAVWNQWAGCDDVAPCQLNFGGYDEILEAGQENVVEDAASSSVTHSSMKKSVLVACSSDSDLQDQLNAIVQAHAKSLKHQRRVFAPELASPSPAKSISDTDFAYHASLALSQAKERGTPAKSPSPLACDDVTPCQLSFADEPVANHVAPKLPKVQLMPFDVSEIPSPTRNRAKRQQAAWSTLPMSDDVPQTFPESSAAPPQPTVPENEEAARLQAIRQAARTEELAMDKNCMDTFLDCVKQCAWHERVRTPIKGSNLYTKHIRPCRPVGTSVDVKDSTFRNLANFLKFLECEGLLRLKPGVSDPIVTEIRFDACRNYKYDPQSRHYPSDTVEVTTHNDGTPGFKWQ